MTEMNSNIVQEYDKNSETDFVPVVICFACINCAYAAADLAGSMRLQYPANVRIINIKCTGKVDPIFLLKALENGADAVFVAGCAEGDCHYLEGNVQANKRVSYTKKLLSEIGLESERVKMYFIHASMGSKFAEAAIEMTNIAKRLGPNPLKNIRSHSGGPVTNRNDEK